MTSNERETTRTDDESTQPWSVGTASRVITPEEPIMLAGYGDRTARSTGVARDLRATALAVEDTAGKRAVIVGLDLLGVTRDLRAAVARRCRDKFGLASDDLLLNASHTHHGPEYRVDEWRVWDAEGENDRRAREYREHLEAAIVDVVSDALDARSPAALRYTHGRCGFGMNRRRPTAGFTLEPYPDGPVDVDIPVLVATCDDAVQAVVFGYACHPTSLPKGTEFHPDWPGVAAAHLEETYPEATALFLQGCGADVNPYPRRTPEHTNQHGRTIANAVQAAVAGCGTPVHGPLRTCTGDLTLDFEEQPDRAELEAQLEASNGRDRYASRFLNELDRDGSIRTEFLAPVQSIGFGTDLTLVALPGEVDIAYARDVRTSLTGDTWVAGYSNQGYVYLPSARLLREGGYEATWVFLYWDYPAPLKPSNQERIEETALALAQRVGATRCEPSR